MNQAGRGARMLTASGSVAKQRDPNFVGFDQSTLIDEVGLAVWPGPGDESSQMVPVGSVVQTIRCWRYIGDFAGC